MAFIGNQPTAVPLTSSQLADGLITTAKLAADAVTSAKIADSTIVNADIASTTINLTQKVTGTLPFANGGTGLSTLGTSGQALVVNSSATALEYSTVGAQAGQVIQVVSTVKTADQSTTSTSPVDVTDLSVNITPSSASNKVLVLVNINNISNRILRGSTVITSNTSGGSADTKNAFGSGGGGGMTNENRKLGSASIAFLDTPSSTSALTYKVTFEVDGGTGTINRWELNTDVASVSTLTLMEIKG